jgi:hypothetical protein
MTDSAWHKHSPFAFWLLFVLKPKMIVELGVHNGFSFFVFCEFAQQSKGRTLCYAVDHWKGDEHAGFYEDKVFEEFSAHQAQYGKLSKVVKATFDEALDQFQDGSIDFLHVDGRHFYDDVKHDFNNWRKKLKKDAIVLFHDTAVLERDFGVHLFWAELRQEFPLTFEFRHGHGLGILCYGDGAALPSKVYRFFHLSPKEALEAENIYKALGNQIHYSFLLDAYKIPYSRD